MITACLISGMFVRYEDNSELRLIKSVGSGLFCLCASRTSSRLCEKFNYAR
jgi:hypothetical protein